MATYPKILPSDLQGMLPSILFGPNPSRASCVADLKGLRGATFYMLTAGEGVEKLSTDPPNDAFVYDKTHPNQNGHTEPGSMAASFNYLQGLHRSE